MDAKELKKIMASLGIASLVAAVGVATPPALHAASGWGAKDDSAVGAEKAKPASGSGWGGNKEGAVSTEEDEVKKKPGDSGWSGQKEGAVGTEEEEMKKKPGSSGWGGQQ